MTLPSDPIPETPDHRAAISRRVQEATGLDDKTLETLVRAFYARARTDSVIGHLFDGVEDWEKHIRQITTFWSSVALMSGRYHGQPLPVHAKLPLESRHFERWLLLFQQTLDEVCSEAAKPYLMEKARRIASSLEMGVAFARGIMPSPRDAWPKGATA